MEDLEVNSFNFPSPHFPGSSLEGQRIYASEPVTLPPYPHSPKVDSDLGCRSHPLLGDVRVFTLQFVQKKSACVSEWL